MKILKPFVAMIIACMLAAIICHIIYTHMDNEIYSHTGIVVAHTHYEAHDKIIDNERQHETDNYTYTEHSNIYEHHPDKYELLVQLYDEDDEDYFYDEVYVDKDTFLSIPDGQRLKYRWDNDTILKLYDVVNLGLYLI